MGRQFDREQCEALYAAVQQHPGRKPAFYARLLGLNRSTISRKLPALEATGHLLSEDDAGRLYAHRRR